MTKLKISKGDHSKTLNVTELKNPKCDNSIDQSVTKSKNSTCDKTQKNKMWQKSKFDKNLNVTKLKMWQNSKTQNVTSQNVQNSKTQMGQKSTTQMWQNSTQSVTKLKNSICDKTLKNQTVTKLKMWPY